MYKLLLFFLLMHGIFSSHGNALNQRMFEKGVYDFKRSNYNAAANEFKALQNSGVQSSVIYCNLGNTYFMEGKFGEAMLSYNKGLAINPFDDELINNRDLLADSLKIPHRNNDTFSFINDTSLNQLLNYSTIAGAVIFFISSLIFGVQIFYNKDKKQLRKLFITSFGISIVTLGLTTGVLLLLTSTKKAVVLNSSFSLAGPGKLASKDHPFRAGEEVFIISQFDGWYKVKNQNGPQGWLHAGDIGIIK